jgi:subtilase family serine protease
MRFAPRLILLSAFLLAAPHANAAPPFVVKPGSLSPRLGEAIDLGPVPLTESHAVVVGLALRNRDDLEALLQELQDPTSPNYHRFLTQEEFNARYAPLPEDEQAVVDHLQSSGLEITDRFSNRLIVGARGSVGAIQRAFGVRLHAVRLKGARHFAALEEPRIPASLASVVVGVIGLDDLSEMHPRLRGGTPAAAPNAALGSNCCSFSPNDLGTFYGGSTGFDGTGQTIVIAGAFAWKDSDNTDFNNQWGLAQLPSGSAQICTGTGILKSGCRFSNQNSIEIALDVEYAHGTAPGAVILNYMARTTAFSSFTTMYNTVVSDNPGHVVSTSWGGCESSLSTSTQTTDDNVFANANAIGQSWFAASGDNGSRDCGTSVITVDHPANSPHVIGVGGTTAACSGGMNPSDPACAGYGSEVGWDGSGGGVSSVFARPAWQTGCGVPGGSTRLVPDVALEADTSPGNYVLENGSWYIVGGTSDAAPQWAGFWAQLNQKTGGSGLGNPGPLLYSLCGTSALHDITSGSNGDYSAGPGFDLVTGLGTIEATQLIPPATTPSVPSLSWEGGAVFLLLGAAGALLRWRRRPA